MTEGRTGVQIEPADLVGIRLCEPDIFETADVGGSDPHRSGMRRHSLGGTEVLNRMRRVIGVDHADLVEGSLGEIDVAVRPRCNSPRKSPSG